MPESEWSEAQKREAHAAMLELPHHRMDAPGGPVCACGEPSGHPSGWCGRQDCGVYGRTRKA